MKRHDPFQLMSSNELARQRGRLLDRIRRQFEIVEQPFMFGSLQINFTRVVDPDRVLDQVIAEEDRREKVSGQRREGNELHLPYWAELWDSSIGIGQFLVSRPSSSPKQVLDLGCGMGLAGTVAAAMGHHVMLADLEQPALLFARLNTLPYSRRSKARRLNWQTDRLNERFDLIIGADVLYERAQWEYLEPFFRAHLAADGTVLLGEPGRQTGDLFIDWIQHHGWVLTQFEQAVSTRPRPIRLFQLNR